jgi:lipopolysaccharide/colanic/teichoic acid biosynthesis glycosyltransferase
MKELFLYSQPNALTREAVLPASRDYERLKRLLDLFLSLNFLLVGGLPMLLIALGIKLHSPGPVFYRQKRIGKDGQPFDMLKFRSMRLGSDSGSNCAIHREYVRRLIQDDARPEDLGNGSLKLKGDPRITGLGRLLRRTSLDELPQLLNVLRGEMSIVGPRPPLPYEFELYAEHDKQRLSVLPGMTGLWQVTAHNAVSFSEMVRLDLEYIQKRSLWLDLKIIFILTPIEVLFGKGAG